MTVRVAIVDDDRAFTDYLEAFLQSRGYTVHVFAGGAALLDALGAGLAPHVILLDVLMPGLDGLATLRAIRVAEPASQVIMLSGRQTPATVVDAVRLGAVDYVPKPVDPFGADQATLEQAILDALPRALGPREAGADADADDAAVAQLGQGQAMQPLMRMIDRIADSAVDVLLRGESGAGKDVIARELHRRSRRRARPFVRVNCAALPIDLLESELFGHERGAFTGAATARVGKVEFAQHGTLLLDEVGELPAALQAKLLHVLQDRQITRLGSNRVITVDVSVIAATNRDLDAMIHLGTFREDLYYRLQAIELLVPPLRERLDEIPGLVDVFLARYSEAYRRPRPQPTPALFDALLAYSWPGNIRELENMMKRLVVFDDEAIIIGDLRRLRQQAALHALPQPVPARASPAPAAPAPAVAPDGAPAAAAASDSEMVTGRVDLQALARAAALRAQRKAIDAALARFRWNRRKAAAYLHVSYKTLLNKMKECGISDRPV